MARPAQDITESELAVNKGLEFLARFQDNGVWKYTDKRLDNRFQVNDPDFLARILDPARADFYAARGLRNVCPTKPAIDTLAEAVRACAVPQVPA